MTVFAIIRLRLLTTLLITLRWSFVFASAADSARVTLEAPTNGPVYLETIDAFDNNSLLHRGMNLLSAPILLRDAHWQHDVMYPILKAGTYRFVLDERKQYWLLKTGDPQQDAALNFYVAYRKQMAPITRPDQHQADMYWNLAHSKPTQRDSLLQVQFSRQLSFLQSFAQKYQLTASQVSQWTTILQHTMRYKQLMLGPKLLTPIYTQRLAQLASRFTDDSSMYMPPYQMAAFQCAFMVAAHQTHTATPTLTQRYEVALSAFRGKTRDFILTRLVLLGSGMMAEPFAPKPSDQEVGRILTHYFVDCQTTTYKDYVRRATSLKRADLIDGSLLTRTNQVVSFEKATVGARLTYVDFWASWCVPCRAEMPHSKDLQALYGPKGVRFVYVSLDKNPAAWERAVQTVGLANAESYLLVNNFQSSLVKQLSLRSIPRYVVVGKDGRVISAHAPRPSTPAIRHLLNTYLNR